MGIIIIGVLHCAVIFDINAEFIPKVKNKKYRNTAQDIRVL